MEALRPCCRLGIGGRPCQAVDEVDYSRGVGVLLAGALAGILLSGCGPGPKPPLNAAANAGDPKEVTRLLRQGANIEERDDQEATPLLDAVLSRDVTTAKVLLDAGANFEAQVSVTGMRPLDFAAQNQDYPMVALLLSYGAAKGCCEPLTRIVQYPALHWAAGYEDRSLATILLQGGCQRDAKDAFGSSPDLSWMRRSGL